jgi:uncharacterized membrane protein
MPSRTIWIAEIPMGLCARCTGVYASIPVAFLVAFRKRLSFTLSLKLLLAGILVAFLDGTAQRMLLYDSGNFMRLLTGVFLGACIGSFLGAATHPTFHPITRSQA